MFEQGHTYYVALIVEKITSNFINFYLLILKLLSGNHLSLDDADDDNNVNPIYYRKNFLQSYKKWNLDKAIGNMSCIFSLKING